jgi:adenylate cyclase
MSSNIQERFANGVVNQIRASRSLSKSVQGSASPGSGSPVAGHPDFTGLSVAESATCSLAIAFFDMTAFTARTFWEPLEAVTQLAQAVLTQIALIVDESGGHVLGLRGDGLMAGWGNQSSQPSVDVALCMAACAVSLDAVRGPLNQLLAGDGIQPIQIRAGVDWGQVNFIRTGTSAQSDMNVIGHSANFSAKCEKFANSWEVVVGEGACAHIEEVRLLSPHQDSPKVYQNMGQRRTYAFSQFAWNQIVEVGASAISELAGRPTSAITARY